ncbi:MAG: nucleotidyltransferase family protein [Hyphomicrobiales bacterium]|nr:nucleotidyltransferase family protein [Hyphomicrobiales bacterium]MCP5374295.1 nucleotidyltransferase family protein [Hyphomicrobiales bacterium]
MADLFDGLAVPARPEAAFLRLCLGGDPARVDGEGRDLVAAGLDWTWLVQTAERGALTPSVCTAFLHLGADVVPADLVEAAAVHLADLAERNGVLVAALLDVLDALDAAGLPAIPFKGPVLARVAYGDVGLRRFRDLDILMHPGDALAAEAVLADIGFTQLLVGRDAPMTPVQAAAYRRYSGQDLMFRQADRVALEPHWAFAPRTLALDLDYAGLWSRAGTVDLAGRAVPSLGPEDMVTLLCLHGGKEKWTRLQWVADLARAVAAHPDLDWDALLGRARDQGVARLVRLGLALVARMAGTGLPPAVAAAVAADGAALALAAQVEADLDGGSRPETSVYELNAFHWRARERWRDRLAYVGRTLATPRHTHYLILDLPDRLFPAYYPVKWVHDFLLLPVWRLVRPLVRRGG